MMKRTAALILSVLFLFTGCSPAEVMSLSGKEDSSVSEHSESSKEHSESGDFSETETGFQREEESFQNEDNETIYGEWYVPEKKNGRTVICAHGLGGTGSGMSDYASALAGYGYLVYTFDFRGGGFDSRSDGSVSNMSVLTEEEDLEDVYEMVCEAEDTEEDEIYLLGMSQGGMVSALYAGDHPENPAGLLLLYPAFVIPDYASGAYQGDETMKKLFRTYSSLGTRYIADAENLDVEEEIRGYHGPVLLLHGSEDNIVPVSYSEKAAAVYRNAVLKIYDGADHGFSDPDDWQRSLRDIRSFLKDPSGSVST